MEADLEGRQADAKLNSTVVLSALSSALALNEGCVGRWSLADANVRTTLASAPLMHGLYGIISTWCDALQAAKHGRPSRAACTNQILEQSQTAMLKTRHKLVWQTEKHNSIASV